MSDLSTTVVYSLGIMLSYSCDYDKPNNNWLVYAEVRPLSEIAVGSQGNVRQYKSYNTFYLPEIPGRLPESYVDFRRMDRVFKPAVAGMAAEGKRFASLDDESVEALQYQVAQFFGFDR